MKLVAVHAAKLNRLVVQIKYFVLDFQRTEADFFVNFFLAALNQHGVQIGDFRAPEPRIFDEKFFRRSGLHKFLFVFERYEALAARKILKRKNPAVSALFRFQEVIFHRVFVAIKHVHASENARKPPLILIFEVGRSVPFQNDHVQRVFAFFRRGQIEFGKAVGNLRISEQPAVQKHVKRRIHPFEHEARFFAVVFDVHRATIVERGNIFIDIRRIEREGVPHVGVLRRVVAFHLHAGRHFDFVGQFFFEVALFDSCVRFQLPLAV